MYHQLVAPASALLIPFGLHFVLNWPIFKTLMELLGAKMGHVGLEIGYTHLFGHPDGCRIAFGKNVLLNPFGPWFGPKMTHF